MGEPYRPGALDLGEPLVEPVVAVPAVSSVAVAEPAARPEPAASEAAPAEAAPAEAAPAEAAAAEPAAGEVVIPAVGSAELVVPELVLVPARPHEVEGRAERHAVQPGPSELLGLGIVEIVVHRQVHVKPATRDAHGGPQVRKLLVLRLEVVGRRRLDVYQVVLLLAAFVFGPGLQDVVQGEAHRLPDARPPRSPRTGRS